MRALAAQVRVELALTLRRRPNDQVRLYELANLADLMQRARSG